MDATSPSVHQQSPLQRRLLLCVDIGIASVLLLAPLALGGRFAGGRLLLSILCSFTAGTWFLSRTFTQREEVSWLWTGAEWIFATALLVVSLQLLPLPTSVVHTLSPAQVHLLPAYGTANAGANESGELLENAVVQADAEANDTISVAAETDGETAETLAGTSLAVQPIWPGWQRISLAPHATRGGLAMLLTYALFFFVVVQRVRRRHDVEKMLKLVAIAGVWMAFVGLVQYLFGNGKFLWFMQHPSRDTLTAVKGTFVNENHFVHFLALTLGPLLWWIVKETPQLPQGQRMSFGARGSGQQVSRQLVALYAGLGLVVLASLLSYSRGGLAVMCLSGAATLGLLAWQGKVGTKMLYGAGAVALVACIAVWIHGQEVLSRELATLGDVSLESLDTGEGRRKIWNAVLNAAPHFALMGSGVGTHRFIYPTFFADKASVHYSHAESGFLQLLLETGGPGMGLLFVSIGLSGYWLISGLFRTNREEVVVLAIPLTSAWLVSVAHGLVDFNWYIPANMCATLAILAMAARVWHLTRDQQAKTKTQFSKTAWSALAGAVMATTLFSVGHFAPAARANGAWHEYLAWSYASNRFEAKSIGPGRQRELGFVDGSKPQATGRMIQLLQESLAADPCNGRGHIRMAAMCLRQFELLQAESDNPMSLSQIRDAALTNDFESHQAMCDWVDRVVEGHRQLLDRVLWHAKAGLALVPTEGTGYMYLSEVAFLDPVLRDREFDLLTQAFAVRPYHAGIQFAYGRQQLLVGQQRRALALWKSAFRRGSRVRGRIIDAVAYQAPAAEVVRIFEPDLAGYEDLFEFYRRNELPEHMQYLGKLYVAQLEQQAELLSGAAASELWAKGQFACYTLGDIDGAAAMAMEAVKENPAHYARHFDAGCRLRDAGRYAEALEQFEWCESRKPDDTDLPIVIRQLEELMLTTESVPRVAAPRVGLREGLR